MTAERIVHILLEKGPQSYRAKIGGTYWFEYRCWESDSSSDAELWYHSHQRCRLTKMVERGGGLDDDERWYNGQPAVYRAVFADGKEFDVTEDEVLASRAEFNRPKPPLPPSKRPDKGAKKVYGRGHGPVSEPVRKAAGNRR